MNMRIPISWLKEYVKIPDDLSVLTDRLTMAGHMLDKVDRINGDDVIDLELRGNRADCYSILGIARETSALFNTSIKKLQIDNSHKLCKKITGVDLSVASKYLKRVMMVKLGNVRISASPKWLTDKLNKFGIPSVNNVVDLTNFVMVETGQPMHAFDFDRIGSNLFIRLAKESEKITTFQDKELTLTDDDLVWTNKNSVISVAGAIGGKKHSITGESKNILLESASYDQANIRRTTHKHNLLTDAGTRHEKKLDPNLVEDGIRRFLYLFNKEGWGIIQSDIFDYYPNPVSSKKLKLDLKYLNDMAGFPIDKKDALDVFRRLGFETVSQSRQFVEVLPPTIRTDIESQEDLIEEVLRIVGYDKIPLNTLSLSIPDDATPFYIKQEQLLKNTFSCLGFDEIISLPFVNWEAQKINNTLTALSNPVIVINRPSPEIEELRMTMLPNLLNVAQKIINERGECIQLFEIGKIYYQKEKDYIEKRAAGIVYWNKENQGYQKFKGVLDSLFSLLKLDYVEYRNIDISYLFNSYQIKYGNKVIGCGGEINEIYFVELYLDMLPDNSHKIALKLWPKNPPQIEDLTIEIHSGTEVGEVMQVIKSASNLVSELGLKDRFKNSYTFKVSYQDPDKTLTDLDVKKIRNIILSKLKNRYGIVLKK